MTRQGSDGDQKLDRVVNRLWLGRLKRPRDERLAQTQAQRLDRQAQFLKRGSEQLGGGVVRHLCVLRAGVQTVANPLADSTGSAPALMRRRLRNPRRLQTREVVQSVVRLLLALAAVDDVRDVVDRDGRLGDVGGEDDLANAERGPIEDFPLVRRGHRAVKRQNHAPRPVPQHAIRAHQVVDLGDLVPAGEEDEDRAVAVGVRRVRRRRHDPGDQILDQVDVNPVVPRAPTQPVPERFPGARRQRRPRRVIVPVLRLARVVLVLVGVVPERVRGASPAIASETTPSPSKPAAASCAAAAEPVPPRFRRWNHQRVPERLQRILQEQLPHRVGEARDVRHGRAAEV